MIGETFLHYTILREIGRGGMGRLYLAEDRRLDRKVVLKLLPPEVVAQPLRRRRFEQESRALAAMNHPNIVTIHSVEEEHGQPFLVMEWIEGRTLAELIPPEGLPVQRWLELAIPIVDAVAEAHRAGVIHRDLKPANVMVREDGLVKVVDFGIAKVIEEEETLVDGAPGAPQALTVAGAAVGTVPYMSPEQLQGGLVDARSDLFSLGVVLYEMASGRRPFAGDSSASMISSILRDPPIALSGLRIGLPKRLEKTLLRCLAKAPEDRFSSAAELREALLGMRHELELAPSTSWTLTASPQVVRRLRLGLLTAVPVLAVSFGLLWSKAPWSGAFDRFLTDAPSAAAVPRVGEASIAVLPLRNLSGEEDREYFSDGVTEALIASIAKLEGVRVTSRDSVMRYKQRRPTLREVTRELGVNHVLEGSVARQGDQLRITVALVDPGNDRTLWGESYQGDLGEIFDFQREVAESVAQEVRGEISAADRHRLNQVQAIDPAAYDTFLKARSRLARRNPQGALEALKLLDEVIAQEPGYGPAWAARAESYVYLSSFGLAVAPTAESVPKGRQAALKALELDPSLSEAHVALAALDFQNWRWGDIEKQFLRAIELNPNNADAHMKYTLLLSATARHEEAVVHAARALQLDPYSHAVNFNLAAQYLFAKRFDEALTAARVTLDRHPEAPLSHLMMGSLLGWKGQHPEARRHLEKAVELTGGHPLFLGRLGWHHAVAGRPDEARRVLSRLRETAKSSYVPPSSLAKVHFALGEVDEGLQWLEKAVDVQDQAATFLLTDPDYPAKVRADPRFARLLARVGVPVSAPAPRRSPA